MKKSELTALLREYVKNNLSPTTKEQNLVTSLYNAVKTAIGDNCIIIGSYARFTASRPLHDLDILFIGGKFDPSNLNPQSTLNDLHGKIKRGFQNPTAYQAKIEQQTHSITISFLENGKEIFAVDIVPAFTSGIKNEYGDDIYWVPEILKTGKRNRAALYAELSKIKKTELEWWLKSDPRGYIKAAADLNSQNNDFRKATKFVKRWKHNCKKLDPDFKLKSFHSEQAIYAILRQNPHFDITDAMFKFFCDIPQIIEKPQIRDRADAGKFMDEYIGSLTDEQKEKIVKARDHFLVKLENLAESPSISELLAGGFYERASDTEAYLFDSYIPVFTEKDVDLSLSGYVLPRNGGFGAFMLDQIGFIKVDRQIEFTASCNKHSEIDLYKFKVKNDNSTAQPRGEITDHSTLRNPEHSKYDGSHFVEVYAIKNNVCVATARQNVVLKFWGQAPTE